MAFLGAADASAGLVGDFEILAPGYVVGDQNVNAVEADGEIGEWESPGALGGLATRDGEFFGFAGGDETIVEIIISEAQNEVGDFKKWGSCCALYKTP